jgi:hypothetical protein
MSIGQSQKLLNSIDTQSAYSHLIIPKKHQEQKYAYSTNGSRVVDNTVGFMNLPKYFWRSFPPRSKCHGQFIQPIGQVSLDFPDLGMADNV